MVVQASMQAAEMTTTLLVMTLSVARSYRLYANNHPCRVNGVGVATDRARAKDRRDELIRFQYARIDRPGLINHWAQKNRGD
jgi:hypothetical protein